MPAVAAAPVPKVTADRHRAFLALLPAVRAYARAAARFIRCPHDREDAEADIVARAWEAFAGGCRPAPAGVAGAAADATAGGRRRFRTNLLLTKGNR